MLIQNKLECFAPIKVFVSVQYFFYAEEEPTFRVGHDQVLGQATLAARPLGMPRTKHPSLLTTKTKKKVCKY